MKRIRTAPARRRRSATSTSWRPRRSSRTPGVSTVQLAGRQGRSPLRGHRPSGRTARPARRSAKRKSAVQRIAVADDLDVDRRAARGGRARPAPARPRSASKQRAERRDRARRLTRLRAAHLGQDEGIGLGHLPQPRPAAGLAAMAGAHVDLQELEIVVGARRAQPRRPLGRLPIGDARIVEAAGDQHRRIGLARTLS